MIYLSIMSAEAKRERVIEQKLYDETQRIIQEEIWSVERIRVIKEYVEKIFNFTKNQIEKSKEENCTIVLEDGCPVKWWSNRRGAELRDALEIVFSLLTEAGYKITFHEYGKSWQTRSRRYGYFIVSWID